ncbi:hypothetical protein [Mesorhizobium sp.]|nr:hypothetical protein [Mesorhizobium sp.]
MSRPRYFRSTNLFMPDPHWWVDRVILWAIIGAASAISAATLVHVL